MPGANDENQPNTYHFRNLVFEGGGVKGIAYAGALEVLEEKNILPQIERIGGASAGAINAILLALGYDLQETAQILSNLEFTNFMDDSWGVVRDTDRLLNEFGWYKGDFFHTWIGNRIEEKGLPRGVTFEELKQRGFKELYLYGTNLSTGFGEIFSWEHTPTTSVADAARISMSIPLFFASVRSPSGDRYVDGGMLNNYPVKLFDRLEYLHDRNHVRRTEYYEKVNLKGEAGRREGSDFVYNQETLGFRLDSRKEIGIFRDGQEPEHARIDDFFDYAWAVVKTVLNAQDTVHLHGDDWHRTIYIDTLGVQTTDFHLPAETKRALVASGKEGTERYFAWYDGQVEGERPKNRPLPAMAPDAPRTGAEVVDDPDRTT